MTDLATIYTKAADWLEAHEWVQGKIAIDADGQEVRSWEVAECATATCGAGALFVAAVGNEAYRAWGFLDRFVGGRFAEDFNDAPGRTKAEVVAKLREAASQASAP